jgi:transglutaminase-like putative cysteine protease
MAKPSSATDPLLRQPRRRQLIWLLLSLGLAAAPHIWNQHLEAASIFFLLLFWRGLGIFFSRILPRGLLLMLLVLGVLGLLVVRAKGFSGTELGVAALLALSGLKLLEVRQRRDFYFCILLGFFILITVFLFDDSIQVTLLMLASALGLVMILLDIHSLEPPSPLLLLRQGLGLLLQALPLALVFFYLFPRLGGPLWMLDLGPHKARTGLAEEMRPGSIAELIQSDEIALRASFEGELPPPAERYWRALVMWHTDGQLWSRALSMQRSRPAVAELPRYRYQVFLEPSNKNWLVLLDSPLAAPADAMTEARLSRDFQVLTAKPIAETRSYWGQSAYPPEPLAELAEDERQLGLELPKSVSARVRALAEGWRTKATTDAQVVNLALRHFNKESFIYSLRPPRLGKDPTDGFLFETRRGFCEHYASSFVILMRLAGIPSRLVTGYLGGEVNPRGNYLILRQREAHAWAEVWLQDQGWTRVDPTAAVAPERIEHALDFDYFGAEGDAARFYLGGGGMLSGLVRNLGWGVDAMRLNWYRWVVNYDNRQQGNFFNTLGLADWQPRTIRALLIGISLGFLLAVYLWARSRITPGIGPLLRAWRIFQGRMARIGLIQGRSEGPLDFMRRSSSQRPDLAAEIIGISKAYMALRYGPKQNTGALRDFAARCRAFWPVRSR